MSNPAARSRDSRLGVEDLEVLKCCIIEIRSEGEKLYIEGEGNPPPPLRDRPFSPVRG